MLRDPGPLPFSKSRSRSRSLSPACMRSCAHSRPLAGRPHLRARSRISAVGAFRTSCSPAGRAGRADAGLHDRDISGRRAFHRGVADVQFRGHAVRRARAIHQHLEAARCETVPVLLQPGSTSIKSRFPAWRKEPDERAFWKVRKNSPAPTSKISASPNSPTSSARRNVTPRSWRLAPDIRDRKALATSVRKT